MNSRFIFRAPAVLLTLLALYIAMFQRYRAYDIDNAWFLSFSYNLSHGNIQTDEFSQVRFPIGMDGTHLFGKLAAHIQGAVLNVAGWLPLPATAISMFFVLLSLLLWWTALRRLQFSKNFIATFIFLLGLSEPVLSMAEKARYEFFSFFLLSVAFFFATLEWEFAAFFTALLAIETEPAAIAALLAVGTLLWFATRSRRLLLVKAVSAGLIAAGVYVALHPHAIEFMLHAKAVPGQYGAGGLLAAYFLHRLRHLAELVMLVIGVALYWRNRSSLGRQEFAWAALLLAVFFLILPHPNVAYMAFAMPFFLVLALLGFNASPRLRWMPALIAVITLTQYAYLFHRNLHDGYSPKEIGAVSNLLQQTEATAHVSDADARIVGDFSLWYAHPAHYLASDAPTANTLRGNIYLCYDTRFTTDGLNIVGIPSCSELVELVPLTLVSSMPLHRYTLFVYSRR